MTSAQDLAALSLEDLEWPVTWRWHTRAPWGTSYQEITANVPMLKDDLAASQALGREIWGSVVASATTADTRLDTLDTVMWRFAAAALPNVDPPIWGINYVPTATRDNSACLLLCTDHLDRMGTRRMYVPGMPAELAADGLLTSTGRRVMERLAHELVMGMCGHLTGSPMVWHIAYPGALDPTIGNPAGVVFRRVEYVAVAYHTERAPMPSDEPWP